MSIRRPVLIILSALAMSIPGIASAQGDTVRIRYIEFSPYLHSADFLSFYGCTLGARSKRHFVGSFFSSSFKRSTMNTCTGAIYRFFPWENETSLEPYFSGRFSYDHYKRTPLFDYAPSTNIGIQVSVGWRLVFASHFSLSLESGVALHKLYVSGTDDPFYEKRLWISPSNQLSLGIVLPGDHLSGGYNMPPRSEGQVHHEHFLTLSALSGKWFHLAEAYKQIRLQYSWSVRQGLELNAGLEFYTPQGFPAAIVRPDKLRLGTFRAGMRWVLNTHTFVQPYFDPAFGIGVRYDSGSQHYSPGFTSYLSVGNGIRIGGNKPLNVIAAFHYRWNEIAYGGLMALPEREFEAGLIFRFNRKD